MTFYKNSVMVTCLLLSLCVATCPQDKPQAKESVTSPKPVLPHKNETPCPGALATKAVINLCPATTRAQKEMELRYPDGNSIWVDEHGDDVVISNAKREQVAWTCSSQSFQLVRIASIQTKPELDPPHAGLPY